MVSQDLDESIHKAMFASRVGDVIPIYRAGKGWVSINVGNILAQASAAAVAGEDHFHSEIIDFGPNPSSEASLVITDEIDIEDSSNIAIWMSSDPTPDNDVESHIMASTFLRAIVGSVIPNVGFTIYLTSFVGLVSGTFRVNYTWS